MVEFIPGLGHADIALSEIAAGKLSFESTLNQSAHRCSAAGGRVSRDPCGEGEEKSSLTSLGLRRRCDRRSASRGRIYAKENQESGARSRVLVLVDESNVGSSVRTAGRGLDWLKLRDFLAGPNTGRDLIEMVVYAGLPPAIPTWQEERDRKNKFVHWLRSNGFMVVTKDGAPAEEGHYKANVDVMMAIDALELSIEMRPDVVILVTGDADFAYLAIKLRRHGIRVEVASVAANLGNILRSAANDVIDLERSLSDIRDHQHARTRDARQ